MKEGSLLGGDTLNTDMKYSLCHSYGFYHCEETMATTGTLLKEYIQLGLALRSSMIIVGNYGSTQVDMVPEKEQRVLDHNQQAAGRESVTGPDISI